MSQTGAVLDALMQTITDRRDNPPERSYTTSLFNGGVAKIGAKITEEAAEVVEAAAEGTDSKAIEHLTYEAADLIYHLFVMLRYRDIELSDVTDELKRRFGISGIDEKESRGNE
ncbi:MAG: phosphoribosyl-ATP diphosphatase [Planctomycetales bacterium]|nr:phosphoribosyl-ATP diphosphatase [Planctomycetales bacterium]